MADDKKPNAKTQSIPSSVNPDAEPVGDIIPIREHSTMKVTIDDCGWLPLPKGLRERYGETYRIVEHENYIELVPTSGDPDVGDQELE